MAKKTTEVESIFSKEAIENVEKMSYELDKLDDRLERFAKKYNMELKDVLVAIQKVTNYK